MAEHTNLQVSETTIRKLLDFRNWDWLTLNSIAKQLGINVETLADWGKRGTFPIAKQMSKEGWRLVSRLQLLEWIKKNGTPNVDDYVTKKQMYWTTAELGLECGIRPEKVLWYVQTGVIKPLDSNTGHKQFKAEQVDIMKEYLREVRQKEDKARADAKEFNKSEALRLNKEQVEKNKWKEEQSAERKIRLEASIEKQVADYRKSLLGG